VFFLHRDVLMLRGTVRFTRYAPIAICLSQLLGAAALGAEPPAEDLTTLPPSRPVRVEVSTELAEVSQIEDHEEKFDIEFFLYLSWRDPRLAFDAQAEGRDKRLVPVDKIWTPQPQLMDDLEADVESSGTAHVRPDGTVLYRLYYRGSIASNFDLHEFPFDQHTLAVGVEATSGEADEVVFHAGETSIREGSRILPHGWNLLGVFAEEVAMPYPRLNEKYSRHVLRIDVKRDAHYYWWAIVLPLLPIVVTSWSVFWMEPKEFSSQVGVGVTAMLTVVAYRITIDSSLPPLNYMTRMDYFLLVCQVFVFASFLMSVVVHVCHALDTTEMVAAARRINVACRWAPPLAMAAACALLLALRPGTAMAVIGGALLLVLLVARPTPGRVKRWTRAVVRPEQLVNKPVQIHECLIKGPTRPSRRAG
jgi:hypothetical protein